MRAEEESDWEYSQVKFMVEVLVRSETIYLSSTFLYLLQSVPYTPIQTHWSCLDGELKIHRGNEYFQVLN